MMSGSAWRAASWWTPSALRGTTCGAATRGWNRHVKTAPPTPQPRYTHRPQAADQGTWRTLTGVLGGSAGRRRRSPGRPGSLKVAQRCTDSDFRGSVRFAGSETNRNPNRQQETAPPIHMMVPPSGASRATPACTLLLHLVAALHLPEIHHFPIGRRAKHKRLRIPEP
jgi:hypothetical protein